uniref:Uncharacterized protein n=1 Tax=Panagrolaimus sp. PS1159 TaxID=55785 RepID=A0AC35G3H7_9BILA
MLATTVVPILCLLEWDSPKCSNHGLRVPAPKFPDKSRISGGFFSPILPSALTTSPPTPQTFLEELTSPIAKILSSTTTTTTSTSTTVPSTTSDILTTKGFIPTTTRIIQEILLETQQPSTKVPRRTTTTTTTSTTTAKTTTKRFLLNDVTEEPEEGDESGLPHGDAIDRPMPTTPLHLHYDSYLSPHSTMYTTTEQQLFAVRPTTPMGIIETTLKSSDGFRDEMPKTSFILIFSALVVTIVMIFVLCVFCCWNRNSSSSSSDSKPPPSAIAAGYAPIPSDNSPREIRSATTATVCPINGNGISQPVITIATPADTNGILTNGNGIMKKSMNGIGAPLLSEKKRKDFKEWYV